MIETFTVFVMLGILIGMAMVYRFGHDEAWRLYVDALKALENLPTTLYEKARAYFHRRGIG
jgi:membrane protein DedA with SNARE-associated domain